MGEVKVDGRTVPPWWSETRRQELGEFWAEHLAKLTCPVTMEVREPCSPTSLYAWKVRKEGGAFVLGMPDGKGHISLRDEGPEDELSAALAQWAEEGTPLMVEITHEA